LYRLSASPPKPSRAGYQLAGPGRLSFQPAGARPPIL
jgi:hypothetical protein